MAAGHFDADSEACVTTLAKVIDNVVHRPGDSRTRQIRCGNAAFQHKVICMCACVTLGSDKHVLLLLLSMAVCDVWKGDDARAAVIYAFAC